MIDKSPIRSVGLKLFLDRFGALLSVRAEITQFERSLIEGTYEILWRDMVDGSARRSWEETLRAAFHILDSGALKKPQAVWESYIKIVNQIVPALHKCFDKRREIKEKHIGNDTLIEACLSTYKTIYEAFLPLIMAPVVYAFGIGNDPDEKGFVPRQDGRIKLTAIKKMEKWLRPPQNRLAIGLNNHIRNAYSHEYYEIMDGGRVVMWDVSPRSGKTVWGREVLTTQDLSELCDQVWVNSLAVTCALVLYGINNRKIAMARGWGTPSTPPVLRDRDFKMTLEFFADEAGFDVKGFSRADLEFQLKLASRMKGLDQDEEVYMGGDSRARRFKVTVKYVESRVLDQSVRLLQKIEQYLDDVNTIHVYVSTASGEQLGELKTTKRVIDNLRGPQFQDISEARKLFEIDTLGENIMHVRIENPPIEI